MIEPLIIQQGTRKAIISGKKVSLLKRHNKKKDTGVWPPTDVTDPVARLFSAHAWVNKGFIDFGDKN